MSCTCLAIINCLWFKFDFELLEEKNEGDGIKADVVETVENKPPVEEINDNLKREEANNETKDIENNQKTTNKKVVIKTDSLNSEFKRERVSLDRRKKLNSSSKLN